MEDRALSKGPDWSSTDTDTVRALFDALALLNAAEVLNTMQFYDIACQIGVRIAQSWGSGAPRQDGNG